MNRVALRAGRVGRPHGLDGSFYVTRANPALLVVGTEVLVDGARLGITRRAGTDHRPIIRLAGHEDRAAAETLRGHDLVVPRAQAPELDEQEWWAEDLEGCSVHDSGRPIGTVGRLLALPSCEVLEVERCSGTGQLLVPLIEDAVREVDLGSKTIDVNMEFLGEG